MTLELYKKQLEEWPQDGYHIMAQYDDEKVIVYQAYRSAIGHFAVENQYFGGPFSLDRMTWIKPNFLWMMYRSGWGTKSGQEVILAIHLKKEAFLRYLNQAVWSSFNPKIYETREVWQERVKASSIRLQWDPDHDPFGKKLPRRAIQIGIRNDEIRNFAQADILKIEDISAFVSTQYELVKNQELDQLMIPQEKPFLIEDEALKRNLNL